LKIIDEVLILKKIEKNQLRKDNNRGKTKKKTSIKIISATPKINEHPLNFNNV
jgi:hypothetical protein